MEGIIVVFKVEGTSPPTILIRFGKVSDICSLSQSIGSLEASRCESTIVNLWVGAIYPVGYVQFSVSEVHSRGGQLTREA